MNFTLKNIYKDNKTEDSPIWMSSGSLFWGKNIAWIVGLLVPIIPVHSTPVVLSECVHTKIQIVS